MTLKGGTVNFNLALITGASSGLGEAIARRVAVEKIPLILTGRNLERLDALANELRTFVPVEVIRCDLSKRETLIEAIRARAPDLLINNAGFTLYGEALSYPTEIQKEILEINATAPIELTLEAARALRMGKKEGVILNVSSLAGELTIPTMATYAAAKASLTSFSKSFHLEMRPHGIWILASLPGQIQTPFAARASQGKKTMGSIWAMKVDFAAERIWNQIVQRNPIDRFNRFYAIGSTLCQLLPQSWLTSILSRKEP